MITPRARAPSSGSFPAWFGAAVLISTFLFSIFRFDILETLLSPLLRGRADFVNRSPLPLLAAQHLALTGLSSALALGAGLLLGLFCAGPGRPFRDLALDLASAAETLPSAAIIALSVPFLGYGQAPALLALSLYGLLPILRNAILGLESPAPAVIEAARAMGMGDASILFRVRLPLALPLILAGLRTSLVIGTSAATLGAAVGSGGLGVPIVSGLRAFDALTILRGALPVTLLALSLDRLMVALQRSLSPRAFRPGNRPSAALS